MKLKTLKSSLRTLSPALKEPGAPSSDWRAWYTFSRWRKLRARHLFSEPLCRLCKDGGRIVEATVVDHIEPHRGDQDKFWSGPFRSLCKTCHDSDAKLLQSGKAPRMRVGLDGWPAGPRGQVEKVGGSMPDSHPPPHPDIILAVGAIKWQE